MALALEMKGKIMVRKKGVYKIIAFLLLFCLFVQPLQIGITAQAASNDVTLNIADGVISIAGSTYTVKTTGGATLSTGTVDTGGELIITGVYASNDHIITVSGTGLPVIRFKNISTSSYLIGSTTGDLTVKFEGNCFFTGTSISTTQISGKTQLIGIPGNKIKSGGIIIGHSSYNDGPMYMSGLNFIDLGSPQNITYGSSTNTNAMTVTDCSYTGTSQFSTNSTINPLNANNCNFANWTVLAGDGSSFNNTTLGNTGSNTSFQIFNNYSKVSYINNCTFTTQYFKTYGPVTISNSVLNADSNGFTFNGATTRLIGSSFISSGTAVTSVQTSLTQTNCSFVFTYASGYGKRFYNGTTYYDPYDPSLYFTYLNKVKIPGISSAVKVDTVIDNGETASLMTDTDGYLYLYLPTGNHTIKCQLNGSTYSLNFNGFSTRESGSASNMTASLTPNRLPSLITFAPYSNKTIEYSFDNFTWNNVTTNDSSQFSVLFPDGIYKIYLRYNGKLYTCTVDDSNNASLPALAAPTILSQAPSLSALEGSSTALYIQAAPFDSKNTLTYQWYKNGTALPETNNVLQFNNLALSNAGSYVCKVTENGVGTTTSDPIVLTVTTLVTPPSLKILSQSSDKTIIKGYNTELFVLAQPEEVTYEWKKNGEIIPGATQNKITVDGTVTGSAIYICTVTGNGTVVSNPMTVTVIDNPLEDDLADLNAIRNNLQSQVNLLGSQLSYLQDEKSNLEGNIVTLQGQVTSLNQQLTDLENQLSQAQADLQKADSDKDVLNATVSDLQNQISDLQTDLTSVNTSLQTANNQNAVLQQQINDLLVDNAILQEQVTSLENAVISKEAENTDLLNQVTALVNQVSGLEQNITYLQDQLNSLTTDKNNLAAQIQQLNSDKQDLINQIGSLQEELNNANNTIDSLTAQVANLTGQLRDAISQKNVLEETVSSLTDQTTGLNNRISDLESQISDLTAQLQNSNNDNSGLIQTIADLNGQINTLNQQLIDNQGQLDQLVIDKDNLQNTVTNLMNQITNLENQVSYLQGTISDKDIEITALHNTLTGLQTNAANLQESLDSLTEEKNNLLNQVQQLTQDKNNLVDQVNTLLQQLSDANTTIESLTLQVAGLTSQLGTALSERDILQGNLDTLNTQISGLNNQIGTLQAHINDLEAQLSNSGSSNEDLLQTISQLNTQISSLNQSLVDKQSIIDQLSNEKEVLQNTINSLGGQVVILQNKVLELQNTISDKDIEIAGLNNTLAALQNNISSMQDSINQLDAEKASLENSLQDAQSRIANLENSLLLIKGELGVVNDEDILPAIQQLKSLLLQQQNTNTQLNNQIDDINKNLQNALQSNTEMQQKLEDLKNTVGAADQDEIKNKITKLQDDLSKSQGEVEQLQNEKDSLTQQLNTANTKIQDLEKQIEDLLALSGSDKEELLNQIKNLNEQIISLGSQNTNLQNQISSLAEKVDNLNNDKAAYQSEIVRLQTLLDTANSNLDEVRNDLANAKSENVALTAENESLKKQIEDLKKQISSGANNSNTDTSTDNTELKSQLDKALTDLNSTKTELETTQKLLDEAKSNPVANMPVNSVVVVQAKNTDEVPAAVKEIANPSSTNTTTISSDDLTAEEGWQLAKDLDSVWTNKLSLTALVGTAGNAQVAQANFYAREKKKPQKVYHYSVNVKKPISIPKFEMNKVIYLGSSFDLKLSNVPKNAAVTYKSSNSKIATVNSKGIITPKKAGNIAVTGKVTGIDNPYQFKINVKVLDDADKKTLNLKQKKIAATSETPILITYKLLNEGQKTKLNLSGSKDAKITFISSDSSVVKVNSDGTMTGNKKGFATVTAILAQNDTLYTYIIRVRVANGSLDNDMWEYLSAS